MQRELFRASSEKIHRDGLTLQLIPDFLPPDRAKQLLSLLINNTPWQQPRIKVYGKHYPVPRLVYFFSDPGLNYRYSGIDHQGQIWTTELAELRSEIERATQQRFNSVLLNYYRDGNDSMGWHADNETQLGPCPVIASLSLGAMRDIHFKPRNPSGKTRKPETVKTALASGSLLSMSGQTQNDWLHHIPREPACLDPRINLSFRYLLHRP